MSKHYLLFTAIIGLIVYNATTINAQGISINPTGTPPDTSAMLDVSSTTKGTLITRMSLAQRNAIVNPAQSLMVYDTSTRCLEIWEYGVWQSIWCAMCPVPALPDAISGNASPCQGSSQTYSVTNVNGVIYTWSFPSDWVQTGGGTTNSVTVTVGAQSGSAQVTPSIYCGSGPAQTLSVTAVIVPAGPTAGTNDASDGTDITWNWNTVTGAGGYKYSTTNNYANATDNGTSTSYTQSGVSCGTNTLYVWAYTVCGNSQATTLTQNNTPHGSQTFAFTGSPQTFTVPACVAQVTLDVYGAPGAGAPNGGLGGEAEGTYSVTPGQVLYAYVGSTIWNQVWNGGGVTYQENGGDASDIRVGGQALSNRIIVAGGGGGAGSTLSAYYPGGAGGGLTGGAGSAVGSFGGGGGGTQSSGGTAGSGGGGLAGSLGYGGGYTSYGAVTGNAYGAGGGGGYYGGGSGGGTTAYYAGGGGGGSSYFAPSVSIITNAQGVYQGHEGSYANGQIIVSW